MIIIKRQTDLTRLCRVENLAGVTFTGEQDGHKFIIEAMRDNERVELSGSVTGRFIRPDGVSVALTASENYAGIDDDGMAWVTLAANCYTVAGPFGLVITHIDSGKRTVIFSCTGYVRPGETSTIVDPENIINIDAIMGIIDDMQDALTASTIATAAANAAATGAVANFATAYAAEKAYKAGDYVTYSGGFYRITADISATDNTAWSAVSKVQVTAGDQISDLKSAIGIIADATVGTVNVTLGDTTRGYWDIQNDVAAIFPSGSGYYYAYPAIEVEAGKQYQVDMYANTSHAPIILANYANDAYNVVSTETVTSAGRKTYYIDVPATGVTHLLITKYGSSHSETYAVSVSYPAAKTDATLAQVGVAADAKMVGDITGIELITFTSGYYIRDNYDPDTEVILTPQSSESDRNYAIVSATAGDKFTINATGGSYGRLWCFINADDKLISVASSGAVGSDLIIEAPVGTAKLILNAVGTYGLCYKGVSVPSIEKRVSTLENPTIKSYYADEMEDTIQKVRNETTEPSLVFAWFTDNHRFSGNADAQNWSQMIENIKYISEYVQIDFILNTGDLTDGARTQPNTLKDCYDCMEDIISLKLPYVFVMGNHDENYVGGTGQPYVFNVGQCWQAYFTLNKSTAYNADENGMDYYIDYDDINVRLVVLCANNVKTRTFGYSFGESTGTWLTSALNTTKKVLLAVHQSPYATQIPGQQSTLNSTSVRSAITTFVNNGGSLIMLSGHTHVDIAYIAPFLAVVQDCQRYNNTNGYTHYDGEQYREDHEEATGYIDLIVKNARASGTATEDLWSVVVYKPQSNDISFIRFGAGADRYFHVTPIVPGTVTTKLSGTITWSSSDTSIATVSGGEITGVGTGTCAVLAKDAAGNYECWIVNVT